ncbi:DNA topoisomerase 3 [Gemella sp. zg-1178]|uniref:DNA topoisomerase 3 n=1 Tax=Gemella sp. zg-1178 TaxID=2840372 RepID=UPI001C04E5EB|nr:DNA topoisomerase 3 [Gemella sp. zg-1178]MBU0278561.1 DNA topoisomerase 3 [Gemella sp. zg-1178]
MKSLVLCEKPSVARDIAKNLSASRNINGCLEGDRYVVTWALGHLVALQTPDKYREFKEINLDSLPVIPKIMKTEIIGKTFKQYKVIEKAINRKDIKEVIIATDAGREGEVLARHIIEKARSNKPIKRLWISSITDKSIKEGFKNLRDGKEYMGLYNSGLARASADWLVGINASKALTFKYNATLNCGRVQTPTLQMVAEREEKIKNFKSRDYYVYEAVVDGVKFITGNSDNNLDDASNFVNNYKNFRIENITSKCKNKKSSPKPLYNLTDIQYTASNLYKISPKETLNIIQTLYEKYKILTYPRTDSRYLTSDMKGTIKDRLHAVSYGTYSSIVKNILSGNINAGRMINDKKVTEHHAIIPTEERPNYNIMSDMEIKIYDLITRRFLENLLEDCRYEEIHREFKIKNKIFSNTAKKTLQLGYKIFEKESDDSIKEIKKLNIDSLVYVKKETSPPSYFTEGSLIYAMENPFDYVDSESEKKILRETNGIGTVATRADILEKLFTNDYLFSDREQIKTTNKAKQLLNLVPEKLKSPSLTATWEKDLDNISKNKLSKEKFLSGVKKYTHEIISEIKSSEDKFKHDNMVGKKCDKCGKFMLEIDRKGTKILKCSNVSCKNIKIISKITNLRCKNCHKKMVLFGNGDNGTYRCSCGFSIKQKEVDREIKNNKKEKASFKDIKKYMNKDSLENKPLKDILKAIKIN